MITKLTLFTPGTYRYFEIEPEPEKISKQIPVGSGYYEIKMVYKPEKNGNRRIKSIEHIIPQSFLIRYWDGKETTEVGGAPYQIEIKPNQV